jgi:hypothetical protein
MSDVEKEIAELKREFAELIAELKTRFAEVESRLPPVKKPFVPASMPTIDYTEQFRLPMDAAQKMAAVVPDPPKKYDPNAFRRNSPSVPGGFGPSDARGWQKGAAKVRAEEKLEVPPLPKSYWSK